MKTYLYYTIFTLFSLILFFGLIVVWLATVLFDKNKSIVQHYCRLWAKNIYRCGPSWKVKVEGKNNIVKGQSYIVVSNHQHMLDIPLLYQLPFNFRWVSKEEVFRIPLFGWVLWMRDDVAIKRGGVSGAKKMMEKCDKLLKSGVSINIFPEGTRTKTGRVGEFKQGSFLLAKKSKIAILPVVVNGNFDAFRCNKTGKNRIASPHTFNVKILPVISGEEVRSLTIEELSVRLHSMIETEHKIMAPQFYEE